MGENTDLYWKMKHDHSSRNRINKGYSISENHSKRNNRRKKENTALFIDGENISSKKAEQIMKIADKQGLVGTRKVYGLQKQKPTKHWSDKAKDLDIKDIRLCGNPEKDKVDKKIQKDAKNEIQNNKSVDIVCIATSDKGYTETIKELRKQGKKVIGIGEKKAPKVLRDACSEFIEI